MTPTPNPPFRSSTGTAGPTRKFPGTPACPAEAKRGLIEQFQLRPSPLFQQILTRLRDARLDGEVASLEEEHNLVQSFLTEITD